MSTETVFISAEEAVRTSAWLQALAAREKNLGVAVQCLFGQCCVAALPEVAIRGKALAAEAAAVANRILTYAHPDGLGLDPLLLIEADGMLSGAGCDGPEFRALLRRMATELAAQPPEIQQVGRVRNMAARLAALGFPIRPAKPAKTMANLMKSPEHWFGASVAELAELGDHLLASGVRLDAIATKVLSLVALAELRNYRIDLGCALLRVVLQLGEPCPECTEALYFIALQRRRDGRYGFPKQYAEGQTCGADEHLSIYLPLTLNALWLFRTDAERRERSKLAATA